MKLVPQLISKARQTKESSLANEIKETAAVNKNSAAQHGRRTFQIQFR